MFKASLLPFLRRYGLLILIVVLGIAIRCYHLDLITNVDEPNIIKRAVLVADGQLHVPWYNWPAQSLIRLNGLDFAIIKTGWNLIHDQSLSASQLYADHRQLFITAAHALTVSFGGAAIILIYWIGKLLQSHRAGILAAGFLSINYLHSLHSRFATPDVPMTTLLLGMMVVALLLYRSWKHDATAVYQQRSRRYHLIAGLIWGFTIATKYTGLLVIIPIGVVWLLQWWDASQGMQLRQWPRLLWNELWQRRLLWLLLGAVIMHTIWNPFAWVDYQHIIKSVLFESKSQRLGVDWAGRDWVMLRNLWYYLHGSGAWNGLILSLIGWTAMLISAWKWKRPPYQPVLVISLSYLAFLIGLSSLGLHWSRWSLPLTPLIIISAAIGADRCWQWISPQLRLRWQHWIVGGISGLLLVMMIIPPVSLSILTGVSAAQPTTPQLAVQYITTHIPHGSKIATSTWPLPGGHRHWSLHEYSQDLYDTTVEQYAASGVHYLIVQPKDYEAAKRQPNSYPEIIDFFHDLPQHYRQIKDIQKTHDTLLGHKREDRFYRWIFTHSWSDIFNFRTGARLQIWELK